MSVEHNGNPNDTPEPAWYRQFWPWFLIFFPMSAVVAGLFTLYLAIVSNDGLVADDYYKKGLAINVDLHKDQRAIELGLETDIVFGNYDVARVTVSSSKVDTLPPLALRLVLVHPTRAHFDQSLELKHQADGIYSAAMERPEKGYWHLRLEDLGGDWRLTGRAHLPEQSSAHLVSDQPSWRAP
jgi:hypothetical protein